MTSLLQPLVQAALRAGAEILRHHGQRVVVDEKADRSPVTAADRAAEAIILDRLAQVSSIIPVVAEEETAAGRVPSVGERFFLVDPLDGTQEFVRGSQDFTVNIALVENTEPVCGVVYAPAHGWLFAGEVETGTAWRVDVGESGPGDRRMIQARPAPASGIVVLDSRSHRTPATEAYLELVRMRDRVAQTRQVGSSLKFCLIAAGEADLYARFGPTMEWDTAAGHAILQAAGGSVTTPEGAPFRYAKPGFRNGEFIARGRPRNK